MDGTITKLVNECKQIMKLQYFIISFLFLLLIHTDVFAQSKISVADNGDGTYRNPVIHADYSDPDAIRVGNDFYMTASSFTNVPGLPILHSTDLVNWEIIGYALKKLIPEEHFSKVLHGGGVWAPSIRYHNNQFYIYYPDPDFGIYLITAKKITGPWTEPKLIAAGRGLIDPCPLWDDASPNAEGGRGKCYLVHAYAGSRAGIKSIIVVKEMNAAGTEIISDAVMVYDGHETDPTIEGPKFYKRNGYYYIFAPAGGVSTGWQLVLRSKNIYGPYERKVVMDQGTTNINGPHQGAWVTTTKGEDWFLHFQDKDAYGRIVHLQPMKWINDWPVIGNDNPDSNRDGDGKGEPVLVYKKPSAEKSAIKSLPADDEFNSTKLGLQWQWQANPKEGWAMPTANGSLRMFSVYTPDSLASAWYYPNILAQKFPAEEFTATIKLTFKSPHINEEFGFIVLGMDHASICLKRYESRAMIMYKECLQADIGKPATETEITRMSSTQIYLRIVVKKGGQCQFGYSNDGSNFIMLDKTFIAKPGKWIGAKIGMYCIRKNITNDAGFADVDWIRFN